MNNYRVDYAVITSPIYASQRSVYLDADSLNELILKIDEIEKEKHFIMAVYEKVKDDRYNSYKMVMKM